MKTLNDYHQKKWHLQKGTMSKKSIFYCLVILICLSCIGCNKRDDSNNKKGLESITTEPVTPTIITFQDTSKESATLSNELRVTEAVPNIQEVDYNDYFDNIKGCAVFFNRDTKVYEMYNRELCERRSSPNSTFKIISTLIGLENGVIDSVNSTMGYDGIIYSNEKWNADLNLTDAFRESCVWYYRKVIDRIGQNQVQKWLDELDYGNSDISQWKGNGTNPLPELNGFWLDSSLEISPKEQVDILAKIFEGKTNFFERNINILKDVMLIQKDGYVTVYGKTGTGKSVGTGNIANGWFVGLFENINGRYYFAIRLTDEKEKGVRGPKAKEIALHIINEHYLKQ